MFARKVPDIQVGDRFVKAGDSSRTIWNVEIVWTAIDGIPHVRLTASPPRSEIRTIAVGALTDRDAWLPVTFSEATVPKTGS